VIVRIVPWVGKLLLWCRGSHSGNGGEGGILDSILFWWFELFSIRWVMCGNGEGYVTCDDGEG
jgi:hypothetical protein